MITLDFETESIEKRPDYPPKPVGLAVKEKGKAAKYYAWAHPSGNNCTKAEVKKLLKDIYKNHTIVMHNGKFDLEVAEKHFNMPLVPPRGWDDTMLMAFLFNPRSKSLALKPLADDLLDMPPVEQDEVKDWLIANIPAARKAKTKWGKYICLASGGLVGKYAKGDVIRTEKLYTLFDKYIKSKSMSKQYDVEKRVVIKSIDMERIGITIDYKRLKVTREKVLALHGVADTAIRKKLGDINFSSPKQKVEAFERLGLVDEWELTEKGNPKTGTESLMNVCKDKELVRDLDMFSKCNKLLGTYINPWIGSALENDGKFFPWINTIKGENDKGTYTGRFSSNFQQVPREPKSDLLPWMRSFVLPDRKGHRLFNRDFCGQEIRILAHFEDGKLLSAYLQNNDLDPHNFVRDIIRDKTGVDYPRSHIKGCNFLIVYGGGAGALSRTLKISEDEARTIFRLHGEALSGVNEIKGELNRMARNGDTFKTAGGRIYEFEEGFEYVALNTLIQGSAADHSKRALLNIDDMINAEGYDARITLQVHDEFMISGSGAKRGRFMKDFKEAMEQDELFDLPMLTDGKMGNNWGNMK